MLTLQEAIARAAEIGRAKGRTQRVAEIVGLDRPDRYVVAPKGWDGRRAGARVLAAVDEDTGELRLEPGVNPEDVTP